MGCGRLKVTCEDGFEVVTKDHNDLVALTQWHTKNTHQKGTSRDEVMMMAKHP
jgi:predicted small metal-binding protein